MLRYFLDTLKAWSPFKRQRHDPAEDSRDSGALAAQPKKRDATESTHTKGEDTSNSQYSTITSLYERVDAEGTRSENNNVIMNDRNGQVEEDRGVQGVNMEEQGGKRYGNEHKVFGGGVDEDTARYDEKDDLETRNEPEGESGTVADEVDGADNVDEKQVEARDSQDPKEFDEDQHEYDKVCAQRPSGAKDDGKEVGEVIKVDFEGNSDGNDEENEVETDQEEPDEEDDEENAEENAEENDEGNDEEPDEEADEELDEEADEEPDEENDEEPDEEDDEEPDEEADEEPDEEADQEPDEENDEEPDEEADEDAGELVDDYDDEVDGRDDVDEEGVGDEEDDVDYKDDELDDDGSGPANSAFARSAQKGGPSVPEVIEIEDSDDEPPHEPPAPPVPTPAVPAAPPVLPAQPTPGVRKSQFSPDYSRYSSKQLFKTPRYSPHSARFATGKTVSSLALRSKAPLALEEYRASVRVRQQARIAAMIRETYQHVVAGSRPIKFSDFDALVHKRAHVQRLLDIERVHRPEDEEEYTKQSLEELKQRAQARLPPRVVPVSERLREIREKKMARREKCGILGRPPLPSRLDPAADDKVRSAFRASGTVASITGAQVEGHDIRKLQPGQWLNDEVINFYGTLIMHRAQAAEQKRSSGMRVNAFWRVHFFSSFFWQNLTTRGYAGVRRWSRRVDLFTQDLILIPINLGQTHWVCAVINLRLRQFEYYDSMGIPRPDVFVRLREYLSAELQDKKQLQIDLSDWKDYFANVSSPQQENGYDCGVFAVQTLEQLSRRDPEVEMPPPLNAEMFTAPANPDELQQLREEYAEDYWWNFGQANMPYLRRRMAFEIVQKELLA